MIRLELLLLEPDVRGDCERLLSLLHPDFCEYGASGRVWTRESVAEATSGTERPQVSAVEARRLGADAVLVTYRSATAGRSALRSSTWVRDSDRWLLLFHQGTLSHVP